MKKHHLALAFLVSIPFSSTLARAQTLEAKASSTSQHVFVEAALQPVVAVMFGPVGGAFAAGAWLTETARLSMRVERGSYFGDPFEVSDSNVAVHQSRTVRADLEVAPPLVRGHIRFLAYAGLGRRYVRNQRLDHEIGLPDHGSADVDILELGGVFQFRLNSNVFFAAEPFAPIIPLRARNVHADVASAERRMERESRRVYWNPARLVVGLNF